MECQFAQPVYKFVTLKLIKDAIIKIIIAEKAYNMFKINLLELECLGLGLH